MPKAPPKPARSAPVGNSDRKPKTFRVVSSSRDSRGQRILMYGGYGRGKTSLAAMAPRPVFMDIDDGTARTKNWRDSTEIQVVEGVESFYDIRDALQSHELWADADTVVIDNITVAEKLAEQYVFDTVKVGDRRATSMESYGYGKGYLHLLEAMRLLMQDFDLLLRAGKNVVVLAQESVANVANPDGADFLQAGPKLHHDKKWSIRGDYCEWADSVLRIDYLNRNVQLRDVKDRAGKAKGDHTRAVFAQGAPHFEAKPGLLTEPIVSFEGPDDDSLWQLMFGE